MSDLVLAYHRVAEVDRDRWGLSVTPRRFAEQIDALSGSSSIVPIDELRLGGPDTRRVAITFDDGYLDNLVSAAPILVQRGFPATFFVVSSQAISTYDFWWDELEEIVVLLRGAPTVEEGRSTLDVDDWRITLANSDSSDGLYNRLYFPLREASAATREAALLTLWRIAAVPRRRRPEVATMNSDHIRALAGLPGMEIGSHSVTHLCLPRQTALVQQREVRESKDYLQELTGQVVSGFSYPYGAVDRDCAEQARASGYAFACTVETGSVSPRTDAFELPRVWVGNWSGDELLQRLRTLELLGGG